MSQGASRARRQTLNSIDAMKRTAILALTALVMIFTGTSLSAADKGKSAKGKPGADANMREFEEILKRCDKDGDGAVSHDEFIKNQPAGKDPAKVEEWFQKHDRNHDGKLTRDEFMPLPGKK